MTEIDEILQQLEESKIDKELERKDNVNMQGQNREKEESQYVEEVVSVVNEGKAAAEKEIIKEEKAAEAEEQEQKEEFSTPQNEDEDVLIIENKDLKYSPSLNAEEYELHYDEQKNNKILLKFPKKMDKIRLSIRKEVPRQPDIPSNKQEHHNIDERIPQLSINHVEESPNPKLDEFIDRKYETPLPQSQHKTIEKLKIKKQIDNLTNMDCIKTKYLSEYWKRYFPKNTAMFTFNPKMPYCNYNLIMMILKDFNGPFFKEVTYENIKSMLIKYYEPYFKSEKLIEKLYVKWIREKKSKYIDKLKSRELTLEQIIMDENYRLTESDILIISYILNIPIVILYQSKNQIKTASFVKQNKFSYRYYIKATNLNIMYLYSYKTLLKIQNEDLSPKLYDEIQRQSFNNYEDYIVEHKRKIKKRET